MKLLTGLLRVLLWGLENGRWKIVLAAGAGLAAGELDGVEALLEALDGGE